MSYDLRGGFLKQALVNMLEMQHSMNTRVHENWVDQDFAWYRAAWIECGELIEHYGYKWWKKQVPDIEQVRLEVIDIWHFGLSALFQDGKTTGQIADEIIAPCKIAIPSLTYVSRATWSPAATLLDQDQHDRTRHR